MTHYPLIAVGICCAAVLAQSDPPDDVRSAPYERAAFGELPAVTPFVLNHAQILVDGVYANGQGPFRFLLDTGGMGGGRVDTSLVEKLSLPQDGEVRASDGSGREGPLMPMHRLDSLTVGPLRFEGVRVLSREYNRHASPQRGHIDGVLGFHLFRELLLTIDYPRRELRFEHGTLPAADGATILALEPDAAVPTIAVDIAGATHRAHIDTGAMIGISVPDSLAKSLAFLEPPQPVGQARTVAGPFTITSARLRGDVSIGMHRLEQPELVIAGPMRNVNLGSRALDRFVLTFDQTEQRVRVARHADESEADDAAMRTELPASAVSVPLRKVLGRPVVDIRINGRGPFPVILDTGAGIALLNADLVSELALRPSGVTRIGDPGDPEALEVDKLVLDDVAIGGATLTKVPAVAWPDDSISGQLGDVRGIIGLPVFKDCLVSLDFKALQLRLSDERLRRNDGSIPYAADDLGLPNFAIDVAGQLANAHIDTGNTRGVALPTRYMEKLTMQGELARGRARTASGTHEIRIGQLDGVVQIGERKLTDPPVHFIDLSPHVNIGGDVIDGMVLTYDQRSRRLRLAGDATPKRTRYGIMLAPQPGEPIRIQAVIPGSIAAQAGLHAGDVIVRVNDIDAATLDPTAQRRHFTASPLALVVRRDGEEMAFKLAHDE